jgi:hypothetical protein
VAERIPIARWVGLLLRDRDAAGGTDKAEERASGKPGSGPTACGKSRPGRTPSRILIVHASRCRGRQRPSTNLICCLPMSASALRRRLRKVLEGGPDAINSLSHNPEPRSLDSAAAPVLRPRQEGSLHPLENFRGLGASGAMGELIGKESLVVNRKNVVPPGLQRSRSLPR